MARRRRAILNRDDLLYEQRRLAVKYPEAYRDYFSMKENRDQPDEDIPEILEKKYGHNAWFWAHKLDEIWARLGWNNEKAVSEETGLDND